MVFQKKTWLTRFRFYVYIILGFPSGISGKEPACQCKRLTHWFDPWVRRSPGGGHGNPLQYSCLESRMGRGVWQATVHEVAKSRIWLKWHSVHACIILVVWWHSFLYWRPVIFFPWPPLSFSLDDKFVWSQWLWAKKKNKPKKIIIV